MVGHWTIHYGADTQGNLVRIIGPSGGNLVPDENNKEPLLLQVPVSNGIADSSYTIQSFLMENVNLTDVNSYLYDVYTFSDPNSLLGSTVSFTKNELMLAHNSQTPQTLTDKFNAIITAGYTDADGMIPLNGSMNQSAGPRLLISNGRILVEASTGRAICLSGGTEAQITELYPNYFHTGVVVNNTPGDAGILHVAHIAPDSETSPTYFNIKIQPAPTDGVDVVDVFFFHSDAWPQVDFVTTSTLTHLGNGEYQMSGLRPSSVQDQTGFGSGSSYFFVISTQTGSANYEANKFVVIGSGGQAHIFDTYPDDFHAIIPYVSSISSQGDIVGSFNEGTPPDINYVMYGNALPSEWGAPFNNNSMDIELVFGFPWVLPAAYTGTMQMFITHPTITSGQWVEIPTINTEQSVYSAYNDQYASKFITPSSIDIDSTTYAIYNDFFVIKFVADGHQLKISGQNVGFSF